MKEFEYTVKAADGLHARPAGILVSKAAAYTCDITIESKGKDASLKKLFAIMKLGVKQNDKIKVTFSGVDEEAAYAEVKSIIEENF